MMNDHGKRAWFAHPVLIGFNEGLAISLILLVSIGQVFTTEALIVFQAGLSLVGAVLMGRASYLTLLDEVSHDDSSVAFRAASWVATGYVAGGTIPILVPFLFSAHPIQWTVGISFVLIAIFSYLKGFFSATGPWSRMIFTLIIISLATLSAFGVARLFVLR